MGKRKIKHVKEFTVKRSKWWRGKGEDKSSLRKPGGKQCCLGFYARACGMKAKDIKNVRLISSIKENQVKFELLSAFGVHDEFDLAQINDDEFYDDITREQKLINRFVKHGITVTFED